MPENSGWFAGRALLISQVQTEFFVWVDDDFEFTAETNLEKLVEVISKTGYDVIGGSIGIISKKLPRGPFWVFVLKTFCFCLFRF